MPIRFSCSACGKKLRVKDEYAGRRSKCPACGWGIVVPFEPTWEESDSPAEPIPAPPPPLPGVSSTSTLPAALAQIQTSEDEDDEPQTWKPSKPAASRSAPTNRIMLAFVGAGGLILIAGFAFVSLRASGRKPIQPASAAINQSEGSEREPSLVPANPRQPVSRDSAGLRYRFLSADIGRALLEESGKDVFSVRLSRKVSKTALKEIAREIESNKPRNPRTGIRNRRTVVFFYLPEVDAFGPDGPFGATWALADLNGTGTGTQRNRNGGTGTGTQLVWEPERGRS